MCTKCGERLKTTPTQALIKTIHLVILMKMFIYFLHHNVLIVIIKKLTSITRKSSVFFSPKTIHEVWT